VEKKDVNMHLTAERIQGFLDGALSKEERVHVEEHATFCASCQAELDAWQLLYSELSELPGLAPSEGFASRVLAGLQVTEPTPEVVAVPETSKAGAFGWLRHRAARVAQHLGPERLQDYVDGVLPEPQMARIETHLDGCGACRTEAATWKELVRRIETLPELAPSAGFAQRVMAHVRIGQLVREPVAVSTRDRVLAWAGGLVPRTQKAWAVISGVAVTPATVVALLAYAVFSNPAVTPGYLASFLWWKVSGAATAVAGLAADTLFENAIMFYAYSALEALAGAPVLGAMVTVSLAAATSVSGWVLYRNLFPTPKVDGQYATASI
jgi:anti-sigma factor RsiW